MKVIDFGFRDYLIIDIKIVFFSFYFIDRIQMGVFSKRLRLSMQYRFGLTDYRSNKRRRTNNINSFGSLKKTNSFDPNASDIASDQQSALQARMKKANE